MPRNASRFLICIVILPQTLAVSIDGLPSPFGFGLGKPSHLAPLQVIGLHNVSVARVTQPAGGETETDAYHADPFLPINSEGEHVGNRKVLDVILLFIALLVPFAIYGVIRLHEHLHKHENDAVQEEEQIAANQPPQRMGSNYRIPNTRNAPVPLTPMLRHNTDMNAEGSHLQNILAGFSTAMAALPDAISFSFITGVSPLNGIWAGAIMGISAALVGGRPGMISSASAATAVVLADISTDKEYGMGPMALCVFIVGILQLIAGWLRLSRLISMIPHPVMLGFVNGLAIVMVRAQLRQYHYQGDGPWVEGKYILSMTVTAVFAIFAALAWGRLNKILPERFANITRFLPAPLASVILTTVFSFIVDPGLPRRSLKDVAGARTFRGGFATMPSWDFPPTAVNWHSSHMWGKVIWTAVRFAIVGLLESLMTQALIDQETNTSGSGRRECFGQGVGNILSSLFGTQGGCALIAQSLMNIGSGGLSRVSGLTMGISLGVCVVVLAPVMAIIPVAALVGLITLIAINTFAWSSVLLILKINWIDAIVVVIVTVVTVWHDLAVAVIIGLIINALGFAWRSATNVRLLSESIGEDTRNVALQGPLFFGSAMNYKKMITPGNFTEKEIVLDFSQGSILDISAADAIVSVYDRLKDAGKIVKMKGVPDEAKKDMGKIDPSCYMDD